MAGDQHIVALRQASGILEPRASLYLATPAKKDSNARRRSDHLAADSGALLVNTGYTDTLADRIKSGSSRRNTKTHMALATMAPVAVAVDAQNFGLRRHSGNAKQNMSSTIASALGKQQLHAVLESDSSERAPHLGVSPAAFSAVQRGDQTTERSKKSQKSNGTKSSLAPETAQVVHWPEEPQVTEVKVKA